MICDGHNVPLLSEARRLRYISRYITSLAFLIRFSGKAKHLREHYNVLIHKDNFASVVSIAGCDSSEQNLCHAKNGGIRL